MGLLSSFADRTTILEPRADVDLQSHQQSKDGTANCQVQRPGLLYVLKPCLQ